MIISVLHRTTYRYESPVRGVVQSHRLTPSRFAGQKVLSWSVTVQGGKLGCGFRDGAGDWIENWTIPGPATEVEVIAEGVVETKDLAGILKDHREICPPDAYLRFTKATKPDEALLALAHSRNAPDGLSLCHELSLAVTNAVAYQPGVTHAQTTAAESLARGAGVCQDHAQVLIAIARARDIPARYVSGYLVARNDGLAHEAAHAWAELYVPGFGWIGFDPANACCPDARYIRLGSELDAAHAAPIRGVARVGAAENLGVSVAIGEMAQ